MQQIDNNDILPATEPMPVLVELRGPSGRLYGMFNPQSLVIEFKTQRGGSVHSKDAREVIDLKPYLEAAKL